MTTNATRAPSLAAETANDPYEAASHLARRLRRADAVAFLGELWMCVNPQQIRDLVERYEVKAVAK